MNAQIKKLTQAFPAFRLRLADNKRWALMAGAGLAVAATAIIVSVLWTSNRGYVSLYGRQENLPVSQIVTVLDGEKLTYRIDPQSGQILVPEDELSKTRMTLAAKGVQAILPSGYELMDKDEVLGSSQFVQNVRYKRRPRRGAGAEHHVAGRGGERTGASGAQRRELFCGQR